MKITAVLILISPCANHSFVGCGQLCLVRPTQTSFCEANSRICTSYMFLLILLRHVKCPPLQMLRSEIIVNVSFLDLWSK